MLFQLLISAFRIDAEFISAVNLVCLLNEILAAFWAVIIIIVSIFGWIYNKKN